MSEFSKHQLQLRFNESGMSKKNSPISVLLSNESSR